MDWTIILGSSLAAAISAGLFALLQGRQKHRFEKEDRDAAAKEKEEAENNVERKALRYIMLYIIQERCKDHIASGRITMEDRRAIHKWHDLYHNGLDGNGDADDLMGQVDELPIDVT